MAVQLEVADEEAMGRTAHLGSWSGELLSHLTHAPAP
jgi:hypothetical protein